MAFVECGHTGVGIATFCDAEIEGSFRFSEAVLGEFEFVGVGVRKFLEETLGFWKLVVGGDGLFNVGEGGIWVRIGPSGVAVCEEFSAGRCNEDSLMDAVGVT